MVLILRVVVTIRRPCRAPVLPARLADGLPVPRRVHLVALLGELPAPRAGQGYAMVSHVDSIDLGNLSVNLFLSTANRRPVGGPPTPMRAPGRSCFPRRV